MTGPPEEWYEFYVDRATSIIWMDKTEGMSCIGCSGPLETLNSQPSLVDTYEAHYNDNNRVFIRLHFGYSEKVVLATKKGDEDPVYEVIYIEPTLKSSMLVPH
jgi:hypothetical protein